MSILDQAVAAVRQLTSAEIAQRLNDIREEEKALRPIYRATVRREREQKLFEEMKETA